MEIIENKKEYGRIRLKSWYSRRLDRTEEKEFRAMTSDELKALRKGTWVYVREGDRHWKQLRINGKVKTWKRSPEKFKIPTKYGWSTYAYITENDLGKVLVALETGI